MSGTKSLEDCCRVCATHSSTLQSIHKAAHDDKRTIDMLEYCLQHPIDTNEQIPDCICDECVSNLIITYEFFVLYKQSEEYFLSRVEELNETNKIPIKIEEIQIPEMNEIFIPEIKTELNDDKINRDDDVLAELSGSPNEFLLKCEFDSNEEFSSSLNLQTEIIESTATANQIKPNENFQCKECGKTFQFTSKYKQHLISHNRERRIACTQCPQKCKTNADFRKHLRTHSGEKKFICKTCPMRFAGLGDLRRHIQIHLRENGNVKVHTCPECGKIFRYSNSLKSHLVVHGTDRPFECTQCFSKFKQKATLKKHFLLKHMRVDVEERSIELYECFDCKKSFNHLMDLCRHMREHLFEKPFKCSICKLNFATERWMLKHKKNHTNLIHDCEYCNRSFDNKNDLKNHVRTSHETELRTYECNQCSQTFTLKSLFTSHLTKHKKHPESHLCAECGKVFETNTTLNTHLILHRNDKPFACTQCPAKFKTKQILNIHSTVHNDEYKYVCEICNKSFRYRASLREHKLTHTERQFKCETCPKSFHTNAKLIRHVRTHTGERPYKCEYCDRAFTQNGDMKKHLRLHVGQFPYHCTECNESFRLERELRRHSYTHYKPEENENSK